VEFAKRSFRVAAAFGLASVCSRHRAGRRVGYTVGEAQQTKMAALEAMWETEPAPAGLKLIAGINEPSRRTTGRSRFPG
jgi:cytochrome d ubiquinol oxidase subunit I